MMSELLVSTRKGLFTLRRECSWRIEECDFPGDNVTLALHDPRNGWRYTALDHGHFGVKLHRKKPGGNWEEVLAPAFPPKPEDVVDTDGWGRVLPRTVMRIWSIEAGGADEDGRLWCGTIPGALFRSDDQGDHWHEISHTLPPVHAVRFA